MRGDSKEQCNRFSHTRCTSLNLFERGGTICNAWWDDLISPKSTCVLDFHTPDCLKLLCSLKRQTNWPAFWVLSVGPWLWISFIMRKRKKFNGSWRCGALPYAGLATSCEVFAVKWRGKEYSRRKRQKQKERRKLEINKFKLQIYLCFISPGTSGFPEFASLNAYCTSFIRFDLLVEICVIQIMLRISVRSCYLSWKAASCALSLMQCCGSAVTSNQLLLC